MLSAEKLKYLRLLHNVSQQEVGDEMGVSKNYISMLENRKRGYSKEQHDKYVNAIYKVSEQKKKQKEDVTEIVEDIEKEVKSKKLSK